MPHRTASRVCLGALLGLAGCVLSPSHPDNGTRPVHGLHPGVAANLARHLPGGVSINDFVERDASGRKVTVGVKLVRLGALPGVDGKLYDASGRPVEFWRHYAGGADPGPEFFERQGERLAELKRTATVVEISHDPELPMPP